MLLEDGSQGNLDHEVTAIVVEEEGSSNDGCSAIAWATSGDGGYLQVTVVEVVAAKVRLQQREEGAAECTVIAEEGSSSVEREVTAVGPHREFTKRFTEGIGKLTADTSGDRQKKTKRLVIRMSEAVGLAGGLVFTQRRLVVDAGVPQGEGLESGHKPISAEPL
ncbi:hypothetical protein BHE74_00010008 [Ensete ventricosum]|nr:hypothetical protein BHE74_00010008 [Ensete ventricosum]